MKSLLLPLTTILAFSALFTSQLQAASVGQTTEEVLKEHGKPKSQMEMGSKTVLIYSDGRIKLENGKVVEIGSNLNTTPASGTANTPTSKPTPKHLRSVASHLVNSRNVRVNSSGLGQKDYTLLYFSAAWCPPCRKFTPELVKFYNSKHKKGNFELIFVSGDRDEKAMLGYMKKYKMNFPAVRFNKVKASGIQKYSGSGIPCLVLFDKSGKVVSDSYVKGKYVGPIKVLKDLQKKI